MGVGIRVGSAMASRKRSGHVERGPATSLCTDRGACEPRRAWALVPGPSLFPRAPLDPGVPLCNAAARAQALKAEGGEGPSPSPRNRVLIIGLTTDDSKGAGDYADIVSEGALSDFTKALLRSFRGMPPPPLPA